MAETHDIQELGLSTSQTEHLRTHGITTMKGFGSLTEDDLIDLLGGSGTDQVIDLYSQWFAKNICPPVPLLPDDWQPVTQRSAEA